MKTILPWMMLARGSKCFYQGIKFTRAALSADKPTDHYLGMNIEYHKCNGTQNRSMANITFL